MSSESAHPDPHPFRAIFSRELRAGILNGYVHVFSALAVAGGLAAVFFAADAAPFLLLQVALYFVSLFALLAGISSARAESAEWSLLFSQPVPRVAYVIGKLATTWLFFVVLLTVLFLPALIDGADARRLAPLLGQTAGLAAVFGSLGICAGLLAHDKPQALIAGVTAWLVFLFGVDLCALLVAGWPPLQRQPGLWVALLMSSPLDAFRIQALFALEQIPPETAGEAPLVAWWIRHAGPWSAGVSVLWSALLLAIAGWRLNRWEA